MPTQRGTGTTASERVLTWLAGLSFLRLWSHPNIYRDQGPGRSGKEVCDLIVVFGDHVILFSDKTCSFPDGDITLAWHRWKSRAIDKSIDQLFGAERWIKQHPDRLFLDATCLNKLPFTINPERCRFHLVCVALGAQDRNRAELGGSGSLAIADATMCAEEPRPFLVSASYNGRVVHVFDDVTAGLVLGELDTAADFVSYLVAKENFFTSGRLHHMSTGEENTLAYYLMNDRSFTIPELPGEERGIVFGEDLWSGFSQEVAFRAMKERLAPSYDWDALLENISQSVLDDTMIMGNEDGFAGHESRIRFLANTSRSERRELALSYRDILLRARDPESSRFRCLRMASRHDTIFAFVVMPKLDEWTVDEYRRNRGNSLRNYCIAIKGQHPEVRHVVGISTNPLGEEWRSEEVVYLDATEWTEEQQRGAEDLRKQTGLYMSPTITQLGDLSHKLMSDDQRRRERNRRKRERRTRNRAG